MRRHPLTRRLEAALERSRRENPDGPLSTYAWMWRVLLRSHGNRIGLIIRFASLVAADALLLFGWACLRPFRALARRRRGRWALGVTAVALGLLALAIGRPTSVPTAPWTGVPTIELQANGLVRFEGQIVKDEQVRDIVEHFGVRKASVHVDPRVAASRVFQLTELLSGLGVTRVAASLVEEARQPGGS